MSLFAQTSPVKGHKLSIEVTANDARARTHTHTHTHARARHKHAHTRSRTHTLAHTQSHVRTFKHTRTHFICLLNLESRNNMFEEKTRERGEYAVSIPSSFKSYIIYHSSTISRPFPPIPSPLHKIGGRRPTKSPRNLKKYYGTSWHPVSPHSSTELHLYIKEKKK